MQVKLKIKTKSTDFDIVRNVSEYHKTQFFIEFSNVVKISLHETTLEDFRLYCIPYELLHRKKLYFCCKNKVVLDKEDKENKKLDIRFTMGMKPWKLIKHLKRQHGML